MTNGEYQQHDELKRKIKLISPLSQPRLLPNLEGAGEFLRTSAALWPHPGVLDEQREALISEVFVQITIDGDKLTSIEPKSNFIPLFATSAAYRYCETMSPPFNHIYEWDHDN